MIRIYADIVQNHYFSFWIPSNTFGTKASTTLDLGLHVKLNRANLKQCFLFFYDVETTSMCIVMVLLVFVDKRHAYSTCTVNAQWTHKCAKYVDL